MKVSSLENLKILENINAKNKHKSCFLPKPPKKIKIQTLKSLP